MRLVDAILTDVAKRTALLARQRENDLFATTDDDRSLLLGFIDSGILRLVTLTGVIKPEEENIQPEAEDGIQIPNKDLIPLEQWNALTYWTMAEWFLSIAELQLADTYKTLFENESKNFRFAPNTPITATRTYRAF